MLQFCKFFDRYVKIRGKNWISNKIMKVGDLVVDRC